MLPLSLTMTPNSTPAATTPSGRKLRVLYADDMAELRKLLDIGLRRYGHTIECVANGQEALDKLTRSPDAYDVLITDHHMPGLNGLELVRRLRALPYSGRVMVFSSELSAEVDEQYRRLQVDHVLPKPIYLATIQALLAKI